MLVRVCGGMLVKTVDHVALGIPVAVLVTLLLLASPLSASAQDRGLPCVENSTAPAGAVPIPAGDVLRVDPSRIQEALKRIGMKNFVRIRFEDAARLANSEIPRSGGDFYLARYVTASEAGDAETNQFSGYLVQGNRVYLARLSLGHIGLMHRSVVLLRLPSAPVFLEVACQSLEAEPMMW